MADTRGMRNPSDAMKHYIDFINEKRLEIDECLRAIAEASLALNRVAVDTQQRLLTRD
jgi:hypothetical protein